MRVSLLSSFLWQIIGLWNGPSSAQVQSQLARGNGTWAEFLNLKLVFANSCWGFNRGQKKKKKKPVRENPKEGRARGLHGEAAGDERISYGTRRRRRGGKSPEINYSCQLFILRIHRLLCWVNWSCECLSPSPNNWYFSKKNSILFVLFLADDEFDFVSSTVIDSCAAAFLYLIKNNSWMGFNHEALGINTKVIFLTMLIINRRKKDMHLIVWR